MTDPIRRVSILDVVDGFDSVPVDLALPAALQIDVLLPAIVDLVGGSSGEAAYRYGLSSLGGEALNSSLSLNHNNVRDGDILLLSTAHLRPHRPRGDDPGRLLAAAITDSGGLGRGLRVAACLWACLVCVVALGWAGMTVGHTLPMAVACVLAVAVSAVATTVHRTEHTRVCTSLHLVGTTMAGLVGFLAVPGPATSAGLFLASVAVVTVSVVQLRFTDCGTTSLTASTVGASVLAVGLGLAAWWTLSPAVIGVVITVLAFALLGLTPRMALASAGLSPRLHNADDIDGSNDPDGSNDGDHHRVIRSHQVLTGAVIGLAASAALGTVLVAAGCLQGDSGWPAAGFTAATGSALALRARSHAHPLRRCALILSGIICLTASFVIIVDAAPWSTPWVCVVGLGAATAALFPLGETLTPVLRRAVDVAEYVSLAVLAPLACWVADVYGLIRSASLS
jgi:type VII secretion integral membrane protein EccD